MDLEFVKENYYREWEAKAELDSRVGIFVGLLSVLGGGLFFLTKEAWPPNSSWLIRTSLGLSMIGFTFFVLGLYQLLASVIGYTYKRIPWMSQLMEYVENLETYYAKYPEVRGTVQTSFQDYIFDHFVKAATVNAGHNAERGERFYRTSQYLVGSVVCALLSATSLGVDKFVTFLWSK